MYDVETSCGRYEATAGNCIADYPRGWPFWGDEMLLAWPFHEFETTCNFSFVGIYRHFVYDCASPYRSMNVIVVEG